MSVQDDISEIADGILSMRVFTGVLVAGALTFLLIVVVLLWGKAPEPGAARDASMVIFPGVAMLNTLMGLVLPGRLLPQRRRQLVDSLRAKGGPGEPSTSDLIDLLKGFSIMRLALFEGACFMTLISTLISGQWWLLLMAGVILVLMLWQWPTVSSVTRWVLGQRELIRQQDV